VADYSSIGKNFGLIYTCNCGWFDRGHSHPESKRPGMGTANLWKTILQERGMPDVRNRRQGYVFSYRQDAIRTIIGIPLYPGAGGTYYVPRGLSHVQKEQVALGIFLEVSYAFEETQNSWLARKLTGTDSGFSEEDLV